MNLWFFKISKERNINWKQEVSEWNWIIEEQEIFFTFGSSGGGDEESWKLFAKFGKWKKLTYGCPVTWILSSHSNRISTASTYSSLMACKRASCKRYAHTHTYIKLSKTTQNTSWANGLLYFNVQLRARYFILHCLKILKDNIFSYWIKYFFFVFINHSFWLFIIFLCSMKLFFRFL